MSVGAWPPEYPLAPWHPAHPLRTYSAAPSFAVPRPGGSSLPVGLIEISHARSSSAVGAFPTPYVGDCVQAAAQIPKAAGRVNSLRQPIVHAPVTGDSPRLHRIVGALNAQVAVQRLVPVFCN